MLDKRDNDIEKKMRQSDNEIESSPDHWVCYHATNSIPHLSRANPNCECLEERQHLSTPPTYTHSARKLLTCRLRSNLAGYSNISTAPGGVCERNAASESAELIGSIVEGDSPCQPPQRLKGRGTMHITPQKGGTVRKKSTEGNRTFIFKVSFICLLIKILLTMKTKLVCTKSKYNVIAIIRCQQ